MNTPGENPLQTSAELREVAKATAGTVLIKCMGRTNLARFGRFLSNTARLDVANDMRRNGELLVQQLVLRHFPSDGELVVFDVGANVGEWSAQLLENSQQANRKNGRLYAFEPVSSTMRMLQQALKRMDSGWTVMPVQRALSDKQGTAQISVMGEGCGTNAIIPDARQRVQRTETIELSTVDDYCKANGIGEVALLKVDAEGHDLFVLRGASRMLRESKIHVIQFEYNHRWVWSGATLFNVFEYARETGYRVGKITPQAIEFYESWDAELEKFVEGNYLLCRPDWMERFPRIAWWNKN